MPSNASVLTLLPTTSSTITTTPPSSPKNCNIIIKDINPINIIHKKPKPKPPSKPRHAISIFSK